MSSSAVIYDLMLQEMLTKTTGKVNQMIYWGGPLDWHNQTLTPSPDTLYFTPFFNTKDVGPSWSMSPRPPTALSTPTPSTSSSSR